MDKAAVRLLRGEADPRLQKTGLDQTPTFGVLKERSEECDDDPGSASIGQCQVLSVFHKVIGGRFRSSPTGVYRNAIVEVMAQ